MPLYHAALQKDEEGHISIWTNLIDRLPENMKDSLEKVETSLLPNLPSAFCDSREYHSSFKI